MRFDLDLSSDVLRRTPGTLFNLLGDLDEAWSRATEGPATFSPFDVVGHLIDGEETDRIPRARIILAGGPPSLGSVTLRQLLAAWVVHDLGHIAQAVRVMAKQYREAIGPWEPYLPVVTDRPVPRS